MSEPTNPLDLEEIKGLMAKAGVKLPVYAEFDEVGVGPEARPIGFLMGADERYLLVDEEPPALDDPPSPVLALVVEALNALPTLIEQYERMREALAPAADMCAVYADFIRNRVTADEIEVHPYLPAIEDVIANARSALTQQEETNGYRS